MGAPASPLWRTTASNRCHGDTKSRRVNFFLRVSVTPWPVEGFSVFGAVYAAEGTDHAVLERVAREFSPRLEVCGPREITLDLSGLERLFGDARAIAQELRRTAADRDLRVRVAIAGTRTAARLFVHFRAGLTVIEPGTEAEALASLPLSLLTNVSNAAIRPIRSERSNDSNDSNDCSLRSAGGDCGRLASLRRCLQMKWRRGWAGGRRMAARRAG